ncbi:TIGR03915 family putative DNA repair protein [Zunongwangia sp.]|uniref:TIGR03915 family putative DNA repair protein n=1 Tax=Zunongwangia sp. TaxID=1965325 RepID=UPI003AA97812
MEAFVRFELLKDDIFFAKINPDFNILPLILKHFKTRLADQKWIIYDLKRNIGSYYNLKKISYITIYFKNKASITKNIIKNNEKNYQILWKSYFESTTISSRKNTKLHLQHVPKRYWKFLTEKTVTIQ